MRKKNMRKKMLAAFGAMALATAAQWGMGTPAQAQDTIKIGDKKMKIEVVEYDDRSNSEEMIKAVERLATQDKVDFILPPWSTGMNLAAAPTFNKLGYPHLAVTANTNQAPQLTKRWPNLTFWLGLPSEITDGIVATF